MGKSLRFGSIGIVIAVLVGACGQGEREPNAGSSATKAAVAEATDVIVQENPEDIAIDAGDEAVLVDSWLVEVEESVSLEEVQHIGARVLQGEVDVEPLFPDTPDLQGMYIVHAQQSFPELQAREIGYALLDDPKIAQAVPNYPDHEPDTERTATAACLTDDNSGQPNENDWSLVTIHASEAWALTPPPGGKQQGEGVTICHPDSGYSLHTELDEEALDKANAIDLIDKSGNGMDPLNYSGNVGHGTATGSVLISRGGVSPLGDTIPPGGVQGVAPKATIIPIRTLKRVALFLDSDVAKAVNYARGKNCDVLSMSLGGAGFFGLEKAIRLAVEKQNKIIVAAAGNCVGFVVAPAKYASTIAVAASNIANEPWEGSSKGRTVTITAPGEDVWIARRKRNDARINVTEPSDGTSFATATTAAAAANWIAFHGRSSLDVARGNHSMTELFGFALKHAVNTPPGWDTSRYGPGILDLKKLLEVDVTAFPKDQPRAADQPPSALTNLARTIDRSPAQTRDVLKHLFGDADPENMAARYGSELERLATTRPVVIEEILDQVDQRAPRSAITSSVSDEFSANLRNAVVQP